MGQSDGIRAGLYVHVPFCRSICPYCDFAVTLAGRERREGYVAAVQREASSWGRHWRIPFDTVYFGGGTPSQLRGAGLAAIVDVIRAELPVVRDAHWVLEANPDDVTTEAARAWAELGFRGVSLGVQSFDPNTLEHLGRIHDREATVAAVSRLKSEGFHWISLDLMFGAAGQGRDAWDRDLSAAVALRPDHISCYQLTIHAGTVFGRRFERGEIQRAGEGLQFRRFLQADERLTEAGFEHYEISNYALPGCRSLHNRKYWSHAPYLGLGPSAHSFDGERNRWWNLRKLRLWERDVVRRGIGVEDEERLSDVDLVLEAVMLGLRTTDGVDCDGLRRDGGVDLIVENRERLERWCAEGLVTVDGNRVRPTVRGMAVADALARDFSVPLGTASAARS
jgi:oxygen-independent coproporphyrinogen-3 oxidase